MYPEPLKDDMYWGADKSLVWPWKEMSYSDQTYNAIPRLMAY